MTKDIIKEFLKIFRPDKGEWKSQFFVKTEACPLGILLDGKLVKEKLKYEMEKALASQKQALIKGLPKERRRFCFCKNVGNKPCVLHDKNGSIAWLRIGYNQYRKEAIDFINNNTPTRG